VGFLKNRQLEQDEMWFSAPLCEAVCPGCIADEALRQFVTGNLNSTDCSFCGRSGESAVAADTDSVLSYMSECLKREWSRAIDEYLHDSESPTGYAGPCYETQEILEVDEVFANEDFEEFVLEAFRETQWAQKDFAAISEGEALRYGWTDLAETVKHRQRFFFLLAEDEHDEDPGADVPRGRRMLDELGELIRKYDLIRTIPQDTLIYRCRTHKSDEMPTTAKELGPPPPAKALQSRMSPAGIPMLYAADEPRTTLAETIDEEPSDEDAATIVTFKLRQDCRVVDLRELPPVPSIFDSGIDTTQRRHELGFLHGFRRDVSGAVKRDGRQHIEYVPTQVVAEYLRYVFKDGSGEQIQGVAWGSSRVQGTRNVALFMDASQCVEAGGASDGFSEPLVELVDSEPQQTQ
jgi:RES domain/HEPN/RES N-terminal domain 1